MAGGLRMALVVWATLSLLAKVESPSLLNYCGNGEYYYSGICCKNCPAGTHVDDPCSMPHTLGSCTACTEGKDYTAHDNGLEMCLLCDECRSGKTMVKPCTVKSNTECLCNDGYYCPPGCEECLRCKEKCPEGKEPVQKCNATADMECGLPPSGALHTEYYVIVIGIVSALVIVIGIPCCIKCWLSQRKKEKDANNDLTTSSTDDLLRSRKNSNTEALSTESQEVSPSDAECSEVIKPSQEELSGIGMELLDKMLIHDWTMLMRIARLSDNDIDIIKHDYLNDTREQKYRMLKTLYDRFGTEEALCRLLNGLQKMNLINIYENLRNELLSKKITIKEDKGECRYLVKKVEQSVEVFYT